MPLSAHALPVFKQYLEALDGVLAKAIASCEERKIEQSVLAGTRLFPDMFALAKQVQVACDFAKNTTARLAHVEPPKMEDTETTLDALRARIAKTLAYVSSVSPADIDGKVGEMVVFPMRGGKVQMKAADYLSHFALPNFFFHCTAAYSILRQCGVPLGKRDYMGETPGISPA